MVQVQDCLAAVKLEAAKIDDYMRAELARLKPGTDQLLREVLNYGLFNGGKRIRPLLVVFASRLCGNTDADVYRLGCAFEYLHAATLFHDDIIDNSENRRGKKAVYKQYGRVAAILAGDYLHALSMSTVGKLSGVKGLEIFCNATTGMVDGEFMQLRNSTELNVSELGYHDAIMLKTGLLIAAACEVGAIYGGGSREQVKALRSYGENIGCAFQIIDDLLDYLGDPDKTGKTVGNDLAEGKMTLPLIFALACAGKEDQERLQCILMAQDKRIECAEEVKDIINKTGGFAAARKKAVDAVDNAIAALKVFHGQANRYERDVLEGLARYVLTREK